MSKYNVRIGKDFEIDAFEVNDDLVPKVANAVEQIEKVRTRRQIAVWAAIAISIALIVATLIGYSDGSYNEVKSVWDSAKIPVGFILANYFY